MVWVEHDGDSTVSYVRGIRGEPRDFLRTRDVLTWSVRSPAWHWSAIDIDHANKKLFLADTADRFAIVDFPNALHILWNPGKFQPPGDWDTTN